jgi:Ca-activated chloride channel family protein
MSVSNRLPLRAVLGFLAGSALSVSAAMQQPNDEESQLLEEIIVTAGMRVTAGGAQDLKFARAEISGGRIPHPEAITAEGLLGEHDLTLLPAAKCKQLLCLVGESTAARLPALPHARYLVQLGFASSISEATWDREPLNLVAVIDKSGSMSGQPLALVKRSLRGLLENLREGDQLSIVLYGDRSHVHMQPTRASLSTLPRMQRAVDRIESEGSTNMEEGLEVGYEVARRTRATFDGITRVALFTDEQPNVGSTDAGSFIAMAREASLDGIGLTTVGVGVQFDSGLATALSSTRGGNLFFLDGAAAADALFTDELDYMVSELAYDLTVTLRPADGYRIAGVYGVPAEVLGWHDGTSVTITVPTLFLSRPGGGLFVSLAPEDALADLPQRPLEADAPLLAVSHSYVPVGGTAGESGSLTVGAPAAASSDGLTLGHALIDEYLSLRAAAAAHHIANDDEQAYTIVRGLYDRLSSVESKALRRDISAERATVAVLLHKVAFLSGHGSEVSGELGSPLWGHWRVAEVDESFDSPWDVGDVLLFSSTNDVVSFEPEGDATFSEYERQEYLLTRREIYFDAEDETASYRLRDDELWLKFGGGEALKLVRAEAPAVQ